MSKIPVAYADVSGNEETYVSEAIRSSWISSTGKYIDRFESEFAAACETSHALSCSNGTVALHMALLGMGLRPGDEVIVPSLTYVATANAVRYCGAEPVFVDVDPHTWCLDPNRLEAAITPKTRGLVAVHLMGHPADMDSLNTVAAMHGLWVVEDCAEAPLAKYKGRVVGSLGRAGTFSFFGNKIFTCGEGGAVTFSDDQLATRLKLLRGQGMDPERRYFFPITGYNFRLTNVACAMLCAQFERKASILQRRREIFDRYNEELEGVPGVVLQPVADWAEPSPWLYAITVDSADFGISRDELMTELEADGIDSRPFFYPLHKLPPFRRAAESQNQQLDHTNRLAESGLMLPTFNDLTDRQIEHICDRIKVHMRSVKTTIRIAA
ncbi:MAG: DegT/DnrJ/EryC1/StrS family aminotransferase [Pirellulaceae bacterium]